MKRVSLHPLQPLHTAAFPVHFKHCLSVNVCHFIRHNSFSFAIQSLHTFVHEAALNKASFSSIEALTFLFLWQQKTRNAKRSF